MIQKNWPIVSEREARKVTKEGPRKTKTKTTARTDKRTDKKKKKKGERDKWSELSHSSKTLPAIVDYCTIVPTLLFKLKAAAEPCSDDKKMHSMTENGIHKDGPETLGLRFSLSPPAFFFLFPSMIH